MTRIRTSQAGMTMVELVAVVAVLGILTAIGIVTGTTVRQRTAEATADTSLRSLEREAAQIAADRPAAAGIIRAMTNLDAPPDGATVAYQPPDNGGLPARVVWVDTSRRVCRMLLLTATSDPGLTVTCNPDDPSAIHDLDDDVDLTDPAVWALRDLTGEAPTLTVDGQTLTAGGITVADVTFRLWDAPTSDGPWAPVRVSADGTFTVPRPPPGQTRYYTVTVFDHLSESGRSDAVPVTHVAPDGGVVEAPTAVRVRVDGSYLTVTWTPTVAAGWAILTGPDDCDDPFDCAATVATVPAGTSRTTLDHPGGTRLWVVGVNQDGDAVAGAVSRPTVVPAAAPQPPRNLRHTGTHLRWEWNQPDDGPDPAWYLIYRNDIRQAQVPGTDRSYELDGDPSGRWTIIAESADGTRSDPAGPVSRSP